MVSVEASLTSKCVNKTMNNDNEGLFGLTNNGATGPDYGTQAGQWERNTYSVPSGKQSFETETDYNHRISEFNKPNSIW